MRLCDNLGCRITAYPTPASELKHYAFYTSLEHITNYVTKDEYQFHGGLTNLEVFSRCLHTPVTHEGYHLKLPNELIEKWSMGSADHLRIGIGLSRTGNVRTYPPDLVLQLIKELLERGVGVFLLGRKEEIGRDLPHAPPWCINLLDTIPDTPALATVISQLDGLICSDSLFMHLGGALRKPTLTVYTATPSATGGGYPTVHPATSNIDCSPCLTTGDKCPKEHAECIVHRKTDLLPTRLAIASCNSSRHLPQFQNQLLLVKYVKKHYNIVLVRVNTLN